MNLFARELDALLKRHNKTLGSLHMLRSDRHQILPHKVTRLKRSLRYDMMATLNAEEIEMLAKWLKLDLNGEEIRRLRAALVAESVRYVLAGRMNRDDALNLGELTLRVLLEEDPEEWRDELLEGIRGGPFIESERDAWRGGSAGDTPPADPQTEMIDQALEEAINAYEQGALWLEMARDLKEEKTRLGYLAQARALFDQARRLVVNAPAVAQNTPRQREWLALLDAALTEAVQL